MVIVPSAGETTRLYSLIGLRLGFSLRVKNWLREEYWWSSSSHSDLARKYQSEAVRRGGPLSYLSHPVAEEKTQRMMNCKGWGNSVAASQPQPRERTASGSRE